MCPGPSVNNITRFSDLVISLATLLLISVITVSSGSILRRERGCSLNRGETVEPYNDVCVGIS